MSSRSYEANLLALRVENMLAWIVNVAVVLLLPIKLGLSGASIAVFLLYCVVCGFGLTLGENWRYARTMFFRADVRGYLLARIVIVLALAALPFLVARLIAA